MSNEPDRTAVRAPEVNVNSFAPVTVMLRSVKALTPLVGVIASVPFSVPVPVVRLAVMSVV